MTFGFSGDARSGGRTYLAFGVASVRDMGGDAGVLQDLQRRTADGGDVGPRIFTPLIRLMAIRPMVQSTVAGPSSRRIIAFADVHSAPPRTYAWISW